MGGTDKLVCPFHPTKKQCKALLPKIRYNQKKWNP